jgi:hypothetical protein
MTNWEMKAGIPASWWEGSRWAGEAPYPLCAAPPAFMRQRRNGGVRLKIPLTCLRLPEGVSIEAACKKIAQHKHGNIMLGIRFKNDLKNPIKFPEMPINMENVYTISSLRQDFEM